MHGSSPPLVEETTVRLCAGPTTLFEWRCTPIDLDALVAGRLFIEGLATGAVPDAFAIVHNDRDEIEIAAPAVLEPRAATVQRGTLPLPATEVFAALFRSMFATVDARYQSGGMHAAALADETGIAFQAEDVGRHNAVDKVVGLALLRGASPADFGMLVSSRVSGEIASKAARAGVSWLASRSIPTTLAVRIARGAGVTIVGRAAGRNAFVYS